MSQELTFEIASALPRGMVIRYDGGNHLVFGFLIKRKNGIYVKRFGKPEHSWQKKMWKICKWEYYSILNKDEYVLWMLENV
jgi:hypothetical protein